MSNGYRQEVLNVVLAQLLQERGAVVAPEKIIKATGFERRMPDVIVHFQGLRLIIEAEVSDNPIAHQNALESARKRLEQGIAHISVAVIYPETLRYKKLVDLKQALSDCDLEIAILTEAYETEFTHGNIGYLENMLRRAFDILVKEDVVSESVKILEAGIEEFGNALIGKKAEIGRLAVTLGIRETTTEIIKTDDEEVE